MCTYRVRSGSEPAFERLLEAHTPTLRRLGLITDRPTLTLFRADDENNPEYVEVFEWSSPEAVSRASEVPDVVAIWEPMAGLCEPRNGQPALEFPTYRELAPRMEFED